MTWSVEEQMVLGKSGRTDDCEDALAVGPRWVALADGATDKSGLRFDGQSGGRVCARAVVDAIARCTTGLSRDGLAELATGAYQEALSQALRDVPVADHPACSVAAFDLATGHLIRVGDIAWRTSSEVDLGAKRLDEITSSARAAYLRMLVANGADEAALSGDDPGRELILPMLRLQGTLCNSPAGGDLAYAAINGRPVVPGTVAEWSFPEDQAVVLASDGYPQPEMTLAASEAALQRLLQVDPLRFRESPSTKGKKPGDVSFDDRAYVRLVPTATAPHADQ